MKHTETSETRADANVPTLGPEWIRAEKYFELTGTPVETVRHYKKQGWWLPGKHIATVANRLHVNIKEADAWISKQAKNSQRA